MIRGVLGSRASIGGVLGSGRGGAAAWYLAGGVSAANCIAAYQPKGAASLAASYTNIANPGTYNAAPEVAPTFNTATGWAFSSGPYLTTGVIPATTWTVICRFSDIVTAGFLLGAFSGAAGMAIAPTRGVGPGVRYYNNGHADQAPTATSGVLAIAGTNCYRNGALDRTAVGGGTISHQMYIGAANDGGSAYAQINGKIQAFSIYNSTLSAATIAAISTAMAAL